MRRPHLERQWRARLVGAAALGAIGFAGAQWLDFEPQPVAYVVMVVVVCALAYLVIDTVDVPAAEWHHGFPTSTDRVDEPTSDLRVLSSHQQADHPSDALGRRLVALARERDPGLAEEVRRELDGVRRIPPADIDRILTRIEALRDRT
ncbi:hypothetical protein EUA93_00590 [Nocardioides oleivorans]|uniref:Uncharacterized protein n=1 Tax=Nocardioides oleivorans TaxID=273676 RepID=A0A4Q2RUZ9_9ACTN|nr:hypothetical protein [Nocardioides oleivorans]RYB92980.1 hypothetical protein EUA93_00590 [Nocardioides oleivorans]